LPAWPRIRFGPLWAHAGHRNIHETVAAFTILVDLKSVRHGDVLRWEATPDNPNNFILRLGEDVLATLKWNDSRALGVNGAIAESDSGTYSVSTDSIPRSSAVIRDLKSLKELGRLELGLRKTHRLHTAYGKLFTLGSVPSSKYKIGLYDSDRRLIYSLKSSEWWDLGGSEMRIESQQKLSTDFDLWLIMGGYFVMLKHFTAQGMIEGAMAGGL
jgi:hypothetical protein